MGIFTRLLNLYSLADSNNILSSDNIGYARASKVYSSIYLIFFSLFISIVPAVAQIVVTAPTNGQNLCSHLAVGGSSASYTTLNNIAITESANGDFDFTGSPLTLTLNAPSGWQFNTSSTLSYSPTTGTDITSVATATGGLTSSSLTINVSGANSPGLDAFTISGLQVQATSTTSASGNITSSSSTGFNQITTTTNFGSLSIFVAVTPTVSISASPPGAVCAGTSVTFTADPEDEGTSPSYQWQVNGLNVTGETNSTFTSSTLSNGNVISVVLTSNATCITTNLATSNSLSVTVNDVPAAPSASNGGPVCEGSAISLSTPAIAGAIYSWTGPAGFTSSDQNPTIPNATLARSGVYSLTITLNNCTSPAGTTTVEVNPIPTTPVASNNGPVCAGGTINLSTPAVVNATYAWTGPNGFNSSLQNPTIASSTVAMNGDYRVAITVNGCTSSEGITTVVVNPTPVITGTTAANRCGPGVLTLGATASSGTVNWFSAATGGTSLATGASFTTPALSSTTTYYVEATENSCTTGTRTPVIATINAIPTITATAPASGCGTTTVTLGATASSGTINWFADATGGVSLGTGISFTTPAITSSTTYYVEATDNGCTTSTRTAVLATINPIPTITGTTANSRCGAGVVTLGAAASSGVINWYSAPTGGTSIGTGTSFITPSISASATYYVEATENGCSTGTRTAVVATVNAIPTIGSVTSASRCGTGTLILAATASSGTINWYSAATGGSSLGTGASFTTPTLSATTTYYVEATDNGCTTGARTAVIATVNAIPAITGTTAGSVCGTGTVTMGATSTAGTINWYTAATGGSSVGSGTSFITPSISSTTTYYVDATANGCTTATRTAVIATVNAIPTITNVTPRSRCLSGTITLSAVASAGTINWYAAPTGGSSLATGTSFTTPSIASTTTYYVDATLNGCTTATRTAVIATVNPIPTITGVTNVSRCGNGTVTLSATSSGGTINWYTAATGGSSLASGTSYTPSLIGSTTYYVDATIGGCTTGTRTAVTATVYTGAPSTGNGNNAASRPSVSPSSSICPPSTGLIFTIPTSMTETAESYQWNLPPGFIITAGAGTRQITVDVPGPGANLGSQQVTVTAISPCGNSGLSQPLTVNVNSFAAVSAGSNLSMCLGTNITLTNVLSGNATNVTWAIVSGTGAITGGPYPAPFVYTPTTSGPAVLRATTNTPTGGGCANVPGTAQITVTVNDPPVITTNLGASQTLCSRNTATFTVVATGTGLSYQWKKGTANIGTNSPTLTLTNISATDAGNYSVVVSGTSPCAAVTSATSALMVNQVVAITTQPAITQTVCSGGSVSFTVAATGTGLTYQWRKGSTDISGANSATLTINSADVGDAGDYNVVITGTGPCAPLTSNNTALVVNEAVVITAQPINTQTLCSGSTATLSVTATGTGLSYQWKKAGVNIPGATSPTLTINSITTAHSGDYTVVVTGAGSCASVTSATSALMVNQVVAITTQPAITQTVCSGGSVSFTVAATGTGLAYQWRKGTTDISGATSATLTINSVAVGDGGDYNVVITGTSPCTPLTSNNSVLVVNEAVVITAQPINTQTLCSGSTATLSVTATGTGLSYQWKKAGVNIPGATSPTLTINSITTAHSGDYTVVVTGAGSCAPVTSATSALIVNQVVAITTQPAITQTVCSGGSVSFTVAATGTGLTYQWRKGTTDISGATSATLSLNPVVIGDAGSDYNVVITGTGPCTPLISSNATLVVNEAVTITTQPIAQTLCTGSIATFSVAANGTGLTYQWRKGGANISGANTNTFTINNITAGDAGIYSVLVTGTGACTPVASSGAALVVNQVVAITTQPVASQSVCSSFPVSFSVAATGTGLTYQWYQDGNPLSNISGVISGVTSATLNISQAAVSQSGIYTVVVSGTAPCAPVTSANAQLTVNQSIAITTQPISQTLCEGANVSFTVAASGTIASYVWRKNGTPILAGGNFSGQNTATLTITGSLASNSGNYDVVVSGPGGSCSQVLSSPGTLLVNANSSIIISSAAGTAAQTICVNTALTAITYAIGGGGTGASITAGALPAGVSGSYSAGIFRISGTPTVSGTFNYTITTTGPCINNSVSGTLTVNPNSTIALSSAANTTAQTVCISNAISPITYAIAGGGTGASITAGALPAGLTGSYNGGTFTISGTPTASGTFNYTVTTTGTCVNNSASGTITVNPNATISLSSASGTDTQTKCISTALANITYAISSGAGANLTGNLPNGVTGTFSAGIFTISGTPTNSGTFNYTITTTGACVNISASGTITVNPNATISLTSPAGTASQTLCINSALTSISYAIGGSGTGANVSATLPAGVTGSFNAGIFTISGTPTVAGTFTYTVTTTGACVNTPITETITVNPNSTILLSSAPATATQTRCINTAISNITYAIGSSTGASITAGALPAGVTGTYNAGVYTISGTPTESGIFNYTVTTSGSCSGGSLSGTITVSPNSTISLSSAPGTSTQTVCISTGIANITYNIAGGTGAAITAGGFPAGITGSYNSGVFTISGMPTVSGVFPYTITTAGPCANVSVTGTITVNPNTSISLSSASGTNAQTRCLNTALTNITYAISAGSAASITAGTLPAGVTGVFSGGVFTISGTPTASGTFNYTITTTGPCVQTTTSGSIVVNPPPVGGTLSPALREICVATAGDPITLAGYSGTITRWESSTNGGASWVSIPNTTTTLDYGTSVSVPTLFRVVISNGVCTPVYSSISLISALVRATPTVTASVTSICIGGSSVLTSTTGYQTAGISTESGNFSNANPAGWRRDGQSTGGFLPADRDNTSQGPWGETNGPKTFTGITYDGGGGKFAIVDGFLNSILETPVFTLLGQNSATFSFSQAYNLTSGATAIIEISTDGGNTYTSENLLAQYSGPATSGITGTTGQVAPFTISLADYIGMSDLRIRFRYTGSAGSSWALDDIGVPAVLPITHTWTSSDPTSPPLGTTGIITVSPTITTTYTLTTFLDGCASGTASVTVTVNPLPTFTPAPATNGVVIACNSAIAQTVSLPYNSTNLPTPATYSITWTGTALASFAPVVNMPIPASAVTVAIPAGTPAGTYTGMISVRNANGCSSVPVEFRIVINPSPTLGSVTSAALCNAGSATNLTVNLTGLLPNSISTIIYQIGTATAVTVSNVSADASGAGSFQAPVTASNDGQNLVITSISSTTAANTVSCPMLPAANNSMVLSVSAGYVWTGLGGNNLWSTIGNWRCGVPPNGASVIIPQVPNGNFPKMDVNFNSNNFELLGNASIELAGFTLELGTSVASAIRNEGWIIGSRASTLNILGTLNQGIKFVQTTIGTTNALLNFSVNSPGRTATLANSLWVIGNCNPTAGIIASDGNLTMVSTASTSSNITQIISPADVSGIVNIQSYITGDGVTNSYRGFRSMSSPIDDSKIPSGGKKTYRQIKDYVVVTGPGGVTNGFDQGGWAQPYAETISTYYEPAPATAPAFIAIPHIDHANIPGTGFFTFFRGKQGGSYDANSTKVNTPYAAPEQVTITYSGLINKSSIPVALTNSNNGDPANGYNLVGNPYPSAIDWTLVTKSAGVQDAVITVKQGGGQASYINGIANGGGSAIIQPGQGFLTITNSNGSITFNEAAKTISYPARLLSLPYQEVLSSSNEISFTPNRVKNVPQVLRLNLSDGKDSDETTIVFTGEASLKAGYEDVLYLLGGNITLGSMSSDGRYMAINAVPEIEQVPEIRLNINSKQSGDYKLRFSDLPDLKGYLVFLKDSLTPDQLKRVRVNEVYNIKIDKKNIQTYGSLRFTLVFKPIESKDPLALDSFAVRRQNDGIELTWVTPKTESGEQFEALHSTDGKTFSPLSTLKSDGNNMFKFIDENPVVGANYYRIKRTDVNGITSLSEIKAILYSKGRQSITVYPNPIRDDFNLDVADRPEALIEMTIYDLHGRKVGSKKYQINENLRYNVSKLAPAVYIVEVKNILDMRIIGRTSFIKVE